MKKLLILAALLSSGFAYSQYSYSGGYCATPTFEEELSFRNDLSESERQKLIQEHMVLEQQITKRADEIYANRNKAAETYVIPVVFHIFHKNGPENISEAQVRDCLRIMNEEFNASNAKLSQVIPEFQPIIGDVEIEFRFASLDPAGNCTNGIMRYYDPNTYYNERTPIQNLKTTYSWPTNKYLNCFVVGSIEASGGGRVLGYAQFPGGNAATDGIVMVHDGIGSIGTGNSQNQSVTTHEVGHWLGLSHAWGNCAAAGEQAACNCDDGIADTPNTKGSPSSCNLQESGCGVLANVQNFMDYSFCFAMFTQGQAARMRSIMETVSNRRNLWQPANLAATGTNYDPANPPSPLCKAEFIPSTYEQLCGGDDITFTDYSFGSVTSWSWSFPGGNPSTSTQKNPTVSYATPGNYDVTLTVSDGTNSKTTTKTGLVKVIAPNFLPVPYIQKFAAVTALNPEYEVENPNSDRTWTVNNTVGVDDSKSVYLQARSVTGTGKIDNLISNTIDLSQATTPVLRFKYAYARKGTSSTDELNVYVSTDCGVTWIKRKALKGTALRTGADTPTGDYVPTASEWKMTDVALNSFKIPGLRFRFEWISNGGNNVYLDDIMVGEVTVGIEDALVNNLNLEVFPNPVDRNAQIQFELISPTSVSVEIQNLIGQTVFNQNLGNLGDGAHLVDWNRGDLPAGVYLVKMKLGNQPVTKKIVLQ